MMVLFGTAIGPLVQQLGHAWLGSYGAVWGALRLLPVFSLVRSPDSSSVPFGRCHLFSLWALDLGLAVAGECAAVRAQAGASLNPAAGRNHLPLMPEHATRSTLGSLEA